MNVFSDIDAGAIFVTIVVFIGAVSAVYILVAYKRYRKKDRRVRTIKRRLTELDIEFDTKFQKVVERILAVDGNNVLGICLNFLRTRYHETTFRLFLQSGEARTVKFG